MFQKIKKKHIRGPQVESFYKTEPPKIGVCDSKYNFEIYKNKKLNYKNTL